ncbi:MAG: MBOAT family O-acyltransferase [Desulfuromonadales bacterium]|nr:MBOAT family O-acyltransferase [Desulfuromonadales bacterium]
MFLLVSSLGFYAWGETQYLFTLIVTIAINSLFVATLDRCQDPSRRRRLLFGSIAANLLLLFACKYPELTRSLADYGGLNLTAFMPLHLPLGISFFTFQAIAYTVDVYQRKHAPVFNPLQLSLFLAMFPKISAGPIIRHDEAAEALKTAKVSMDDCAYGAKRFILGLGKKLLIADTLALTADQIFAIPDNELTAPLAWLGIVCYTLQLYFDFSGYSDMAIGLGRMLGFRFRENFNYPYIARSLTEFWRRWHLSLSSWFRDYLYSPLLYSLMTEKVRQKIARGEYRTNYRSLACIVVVFTLCGWWHGPTWNFIIWGLLHGLFLAAESWKLGKLLKKAPSPISHGYALLVITLSWAFFRSPTLTGALAYLKALAGCGIGTGLQYNLALYLDAELLLVLAVAVVAAMPSAGFLRQRLALAWPAAMTRWPGALLETGAVTAVLLLSLLSVANSTYQPFIYFRF